MKRIMLLGLAMLIAGCETLAPRIEGPADLAAWEERRDWLQSLQDWKLEGRVAIAAYDDGWNANVDWTQLGDHLDVNFSGPLGIGSARVVGTPELLTVRTGDGHEFITSDPETDLYWQLGWTAPLDRMPYWVLGLPGPGARPVIEVDGGGRPERMQQGGWTIKYTDYLLLDGGEVLPRKVEMERAGVRIRLIVSKWHLSD